jgi:hypothetical protein
LIVGDPFEHAKSLKWRQIAWNGVRFDAPMDWEIGKIGHRYLMLETPRGPIMEVKWAPVKGKFKLRTQLKHLAASQGRQLRKSLREEKLPMDWARAIERYDSLGFAWQNDSIGGRGVVLYCPGCRKAVLLQFFEMTGQRPFRQADQVLASFDDHTEGRKTFWSVFDIVAEVPVAYHLKRFRFEAGAYELSFSNRQSQLTLQRWGPAAVLLKDGGLEGFEQRCLGLSANRSVTFKKRSPLTVELEDGPPSGLFPRFYRRLQRRPLYRCLRLWHEVDKNRILGVRLEGRQPIEAGVLDGICKTYATVNTKIET